MSADSVVVLDEIVVPEQNSHFWPTTMDIQMLTLFGSMERTADQWDKIFDLAGLRASKVQTYAPVMRASIIFAARK